MLLAKSAQYNRNRARLVYTFIINLPVIYLENVGLILISSTIPIVPYLDFPLQGNDCPAAKRYTNDKNR